MRKVRLDTSFPSLMPQVPWFLLMLSTGKGSSWLESMTAGLRRTPKDISSLWHFSNPVQNTRQALFTIKRSSLKVAMSLFKLLTFLADLLSRQHEPGEELDMIENAIKLAKEASMFHVTSFSWSFLNLGCRDLF